MRIAVVKYKNKIYTKTEVEKGITLEEVKDYYVKTHNLHESAVFVYWLGKP